MEPPTFAVILSRPKGSLLQADPFLTAKITDPATRQRSRYGKLNVLADFVGFACKIIF
jgi:hypothetical protein